MLLEKESREKQQAKEEENAPDGESTVEVPDDISDAEDRKATQAKDDQPDAEVKDAVGPPPPKSKYKKVVTTGKEKKMLKSGCELLIEAHEDKLTEYLFNNWDADLRLRHKMCTEISKACVDTQEGKAGKDKTEL